MNTAIDTVIIIHDSTEWRTSHRRAALLALGETLPGNAAIICVNRPIDLVVAPIKHSRKFWRGVWSMKIMAENERFIVVTPRLILHELLAPKVPWAMAINRRCMASQLRRVLQSRFPHAQRIIQWIHSASQRWVFDVFPGCGKVYHCYDEYAYTAEGVFRPARWADEEVVLGEADVTFVTSRLVMKTRAPLARRSHLLPTGVPDYFLDAETAPTDPIDSIPAPRILYFGTMSTYLDYPMLEAIFRRRTEWHLVMIGSVRNLPGVRALGRLPNVHFAGFRPMEEVSGIMNRFAAALVPFQLNRYSMSTYPLKSLIYMAAGIPVISSKLPDLEPFGRLIRLVDDEASAFEGAIDAALREDRNLVTPRLKAEARRHTWTAINREMVVPVLSEVFGF